MTLFAFGAKVRCDCGERVDALAPQRSRSSSPPRRLSTEEERAARAKMDLLARLADRVCSLILLEDVPAVDIEIEKEKVRERAMELFPGREELWEMIYEARFRRLWEQFRARPSRRRKA